MKNSWKNIKLPQSPNFRRFSPQGQKLLSTRNLSNNQRVQQSSPSLERISSFTKLNSLLNSEPILTIVPKSQITRLYLSKCLDLKIPLNKIQENRFYKFCEKKLKNRTFTMNDQELGPNSGVILSEILCENFNFSFINLSNNHISDTGIVKLGEDLSKNLCILHIDISNNDISPEGLEQFITFFIYSESLVSLDISSYSGKNRNRLGPLHSECLQNLLAFNKVFSFLQANEVGLTDLGFEKIVNGLKNNTSLLSLGVSYNSITNKCIQKFCEIASLTYLQEINFCGNRISDEGCKSISELLSISEKELRVTKIDLSKNEITSKGIDYILSALRYNSILTHLNVDNNPIGPLCAGVLENLVNTNFRISLLSMNNCELQDSAISQLFQGLIKNQSIVTLCLSKNNISDESLSNIFEGLVNNKILKNLDLSFNYIQDGATIASIIRKNIGLENINLAENKIKENFGYTLLEAIREKTNLFKFDVTGNKIPVKIINDIKSLLEKNKKNYLLRKTPIIREKIEKLKNGSFSLPNIFEKIEKKKLEKIVLVNKVQNLQKNVEEIRKNKDKNLEELEKQVKILKEKNKNLDSELEKINTEILEIQGLKENVKRVKIEEIATIAAESKKISKESIK